MNLSDILHYFPQGKDRRYALVTHLKNNPEAKVYVNRKYCRQLHLDSDLKRLLKKGILKRNRSGTFHCKHTYLTLH